VNAFFGSAGPAVAPTTPSHTDAPRIDTFLDVQALSASQWRVCDTRWSERDARSLLGFIEKRAERFDVIQVRPGLKRLSFGSLADATHYFARGI
jgi:hypothetical protein